MSKPSFLERLERAASPAKDDDKIITLQKDGFIISIGANALSNEKVVSSHEHKDCLWFHAWGARGGHVILCNGEMREFTDEVILFAAQLALKHSRSNLSAVSYAKVGDLYKPDGAQTGVFKTRRSETIELEVLNGKH